MRPFSLVLAPPTLALALVVSLAAACAGCGGDPARGGPTADAGPARGFVADDAAGGPRMWVTASLDAGGDRVTLEVHASELGAIFGYGAHLEVDGEHLALDASGTSGDAATVLSSGGAGAPREVLRVDRAAVVLGGARALPDDGDVDVSAETRLAVAQAVALAPATSRVSLTHAFARRLDGSYVPLSTAGGTLTTGAALAASGEMGR